MNRAEKILAAALAIGVVDCAWLSWRYWALKSGWVAAGTGLCSWTNFVDCDKVLLTPQARAFYVPNALLGLGFFLGCTLWLGLGLRFYEAQRGALLRLLAVWLAVATVLTFWFFWLLAHLAAFCPFCPWNHFFTYVAFGAALVVSRKTQGKITAGAMRTLLPLMALCVGQFFSVLIAWRVLLNA